MKISIILMQLVAFQAAHALPLQQFQSHETISRSKRDLIGYNRLQNRLNSHSRAMLNQQVRKTLKIKRMKKRFYREYLKNQAPIALEHALETINRNQRRQRRKTNSSKFSLNSFCINLSRFFCNLFESIKNLS